MHVRVFIGLVSGLKGQSMLKGASKRAKEETVIGWNREAIREPQDA